MISQKPVSTEFCSQIEHPSPLKSKSYQFHLSHDEPLSSKVSNHHIFSTEYIHQNKLPVNLLHSAAQYNKMLITNGKSIKKKTEPQFQGFMENLQFINDRIFQSCQEQRQSLRRRYNTSDRKKQGSSFTQECQCCCCQEFCEYCGTEKKSLAKEKEQQIKPLTIEQTRKRIESSLKKKKIKKESSRNKKVITSKKEVEKIDHKIKGSDIEGSSSYLSHKSFNIDNLICGSLIKFEEGKREKKIKDLHEKKNQQNRKKLMKILDEEIRKQNKQIAKYEKRPSQSKSRSKSKVRMDYWKSKRGMITQELKKPHLQMASPLKKSETIPCNHRPKLSAEKIENLKRKHEGQALREIAAKKFEQEEKERQRKKKLRHLEKKRKEHLKSCPKRKFEPSQRMIEEAFVDLNKKPNSPV